MQDAFSEWKIGQAASSFRLKVDIDAIVAAVYGGEAATPHVPSATAVSARPFPPDSAPAYYEPPVKRQNVKQEGFGAAPAGGADVEQDIIAAARESASGARCTFCERRLQLSEFPAADGGDRRCHDCLALLRCAAQYSMSTAAVRSALHTGAPPLPASPVKSPQACYRFSHSIETCFCVVVDINTVTVQALLTWCCQIDPPTRASLHSPRPNRPPLQLRPP